jgi:hypothetical protein
MLRALRLLPLLVLVPAASCATSYAATAPVTMTPASTSMSWTTEVTAATRRVEPYDLAMRQADLRATLITPRLRKAFLDERAQFHGRFGDNTQRDLVGMGDADEGVDAKAARAAPKSEEEVLVFVAMYVADQKNRDLSASYTIWDTALVRDGKRVKATEVENVRFSPAVKEVFPYVDRFDDLYLFRFPLVDAATGASAFAPGGGPLSLEVRSAIADCVVTWTLVD